MRIGAFEPCLNKDDKFLEKIKIRMGGASIKLKGVEKQFPLEYISHWSISGYCELESGSASRRPFSSAFENTFEIYEIGRFSVVHTALIHVNRGLWLITPQY